MGLKRKRSGEGIDFSPESVSSFMSSRASHSPSPHNGDMNSNGMDIDAPTNAHLSNTWDWQRRSASPWDMNSRTRKRYRDNRPNEKAIHESTVNKLFNAQRENPRASPVPSYASETPRPSVEQRSTLHSFWTIQQPPTTMPTNASHSQAFVHPERPRCEDCDRDLVQSSNGIDDNSMSIDSVDTFECQLCWRSVCDVCAVLVDTRRCLGCACV